MMKKVIYDYASMLKIQGQMVHKQRDHYFKKKDISKKKEKENLKMLQ